MSTLARSCNQSDKRADQCYDHFLLLDSEDENVYGHAFELTDGMHQIRVVRLPRLRTVFTREKKTRVCVCIYIEMCIESYVHAEDKLSSNYP